MAAHAISRGGRRRLSLYVHLPFCDTICYYCACNKIITKDHGRSAKYLKLLGQEIHLVAERLGVEARRRADALGRRHPDLPREAELAELMGMIRSSSGSILRANTRSKSILARSAPKKSPSSRVSDSTA